MNKYKFRKTLEEVVKGTIPSDLIEEYDQLMDETQEEFEQYKRESIRWTVEDFEMQARDRADDEWEDVYDRAEFEGALKIMIREHSADLGITWETVNTYLDEYCRKDKDDNL